MSDLQDAFKDGANKIVKSTFSKRNAVCLSYNSGKTDDFGGIVYRFDFLLRAVIIVDNKVTIPFREFDRDTLEFMHDKLIELGGNPPPLPAKESGNMPTFKPRSREVSP